MATEVQYFRYVRGGTSKVTRWVTEENYLKAELLLKFATTYTLATEIKSKYST